MRKKFILIGTDNQSFPFNSEKETKHFAGDRLDRHRRIVEECGHGTQICSFIVDKGHEHGHEIHTLYTNGVIVVRNAKTKRFITELIAREGQITRYFNAMHTAIPIEVYPLIPKARENERMHRNHW